MKAETLAIHAGYSPDPTTKAVAVPIHQTTAYALDDTQHAGALFDLNVVVLLWSLHWFHRTPSPGASSRIPSPSSSAA